MTTAQEKAVVRIKNLVGDLFSLHRNAEFKKWTVTEYPTFVSVFFVIGGVGDEGTLAAVFCREVGHVFIGKRGGITYPVSKGGRHYTKRFKGYSILQAVIDQRL